MIDYHLHGNYCGHATGELEEYVRTAVSKGFIEIGFSAHLPKVTDPDPYHAMLEEDLPRYVAHVLDLRERFAGSITIKLGIEADYFKGYEGETARLLAAHPFDYVLGSIHFLGDWHFTSRAGRDRFETEDPERIFPRYFAELNDMIVSGLFDIVAHPDAIRKIGFVPGRPFDREYRMIAGQLRDRRMSIEVNTGGIRRGAGSVYPERGLLRACLDEGIGITLGSDAHSPEDLGRDYDAAFALFDELAVSEIATYERRRLVRRPLSDFAPPERSGR